MKKPESVEEYIESFPEDIQKMLQQFRAVIKEAAPDATEVISYAMPAFKQDGKVFVYYAAFTNHIGLYPTAIGVEKFEHKLAGYKYSKGAIQFPFDKPFPFDLVTEIVKFKVIDNAKKAKK